MPRPTTTTTTSTPAPLAAVPRPAGQHAPRVAVIAGGDAQRQRAACQSAGAVSSALASLGYEPVTVHTGRSLPADLQACAARTAVTCVLDDRLADGTLQQLCADLGITCAGAGAASHRACADKSFAHALMDADGVPVPAQRLFSAAGALVAGAGAVLALAVAALGPEIVVKPRWGSGGLGVKRVHAENAAAAITNAFSYGDSVVAERAVAGEEFTVLTTTAAGEPMAVGIAQITYLSNDALAAAWARCSRPAGTLPAALQRTLVHTACRAARALGICGPATVDVIAAQDGSAWVIDIDTVLDWRPGGALAACLASSGLTEAQLLAGLLRHGGRPQRRVA
jgi:D-alanine-D-alanine ligase